MIYITGDTHRDFSRFDEIEFCYNDMVVILGDVGINYFLDERDEWIKQKLKRYNVKFFCIRGNHEERPSKIETYDEVEMFGGKVFVEKNFPNLIFAKDGEIYDIDNKKVLVIGGAYSIDKNYRLSHGYQWFKDEQLSDYEMNYIFNKVKGKHFDIVLTHTCPYKYEPRETFIREFDESEIDKSMEHFLDKVEENIDYDRWYCGHYHIEKETSKMDFMFEKIKSYNIGEFGLKNNQKLVIKMIKN